MATLTINPQRQITLDADQLGEPGELVDVIFTDGRITLSRPKAGSPKNGRWEDFFGCLSGLTEKKATIEEINQGSGPEWDPSSW